MTDDTIGIGVKWLHDAIKQEDQTPSALRGHPKNCINLSNSGRMLLDRLLKETKIHPSTNSNGRSNTMISTHDDYDDSSDEDDEDDYDGNDFNRLNYNSTSNTTSRCTKKGQHWKFMTTINSNASISNDNDNDIIDDDQNSNEDIMRIEEESSSSPTSSTSQVEKNHFRFFSTLLSIIHELCQKKQGTKAGGSTKSNEGSSTSMKVTSTSTSYYVPTSDIIKAFHSKLNQENKKKNCNDDNNNDNGNRSNKQSPILSPSRVPSVFTSNQFIFATLVFLSKEILELQQDDATSSGRGSSRSNDPLSYFPPMPLLRPKMTTNVTPSTTTTSAETSKDQDSHINQIPLGYQINHDTIPSIDMLENNHEFVHKLSILESCFCSTSTTTSKVLSSSNNNNIKYLSRIHTLPSSSCSSSSSYNNHNKDGIPRSKLDEEKLMINGSLKKSTNSSGSSGRGGEKKIKLKSSGSKGSSSSKSGNRSEKVDGGGAITTTTKAAPKRKIEEMSLSSPSS